MAYRKILVSILPLILLFISCNKNPSASQNQDSNVAPEDIDGNEYKTVIIGEQVWMAENLKVTHYRNGDPIPNITNGVDWSILSTGAYCFYGNDANNGVINGALYNWFAVDDLRGLAPDGWHIPSDEEWKQLEIYLGLSQSEANIIGWRGTDEGGKLKESGLTNWNSPNLGATNESDFSAVPSGTYNLYGVFIGTGNRNYFWSSAEENSSHAWYRLLGNDHSDIGRSTLDKLFGFSMRCVKD